MSLSTMSAEEIAEKILGGDESVRKKLLQALAPSHQRKFSTSTKLKLKKAKELCKLDLKVNCRVRC